jgi:UDP-glucose 4-epimerase
MDNHIDDPLVKYYNVDIQQIKDYDFFMSDVDMIFHLAAIPRIQPSIKYPELVLKNNILSTLNILEYARKNEIKVIFASSSSVSGGIEKNPYTASKGACEDLCRMYANVYGMNISIARFYNVYGPRMITSCEFGTVLGVWQRRYKEGKPLKITGDGTQRRDFTHVEDIIDGMMSSVYQDDKGHLYELGRGENYSMNEIADMFGDVERIYVDRPEGEMEHTLCEVQSIPLKRNVRDFIESVK